MEHRESVQQELQSTAQIFESSACQRTPAKTCLPGHTKATSSHPIPECIAAVKGNIAHFTMLHVQARRELVSQQKSQSLVIACHVHAAYPANRCVGKTDLNPSLVSNEFTPVTRTEKPERSGWFFGGGPFLTFGVGLIGKPKEYPNPVGSFGPARQEAQERKLTTRQNRIQAAMP